MRHYRCRLTKLKSPQFVFQGPISHSDTFMLPQMLHPALGYEHLDVASRIGRIREMLPEQCAIAPADMPHALENLCEGRAPRRVDPIFNGDHDRPAIIHNAARECRDRPMQGRPVVFGLL